MKVLILLSTLQWPINGLITPSIHQLHPSSNAFQHLKLNDGGSSASVSSPCCRSAAPHYEYSSTALYNRNRKKRTRSLSRRRRFRRTKHNHNGEEGYWYDDEEGEEEGGINIFHKDKIIDYNGLAKSIDAEYALEEAKIDLSFWQVLERERNRKPEEISEKSRDLTPLQRAQRRMAYRKGDSESKYDLMSVRNYGSSALLDKDHANEVSEAIWLMCESLSCSLLISLRSVLCSTQPPTLDDLNQEPAPFKDTYWSQPAFRVCVVAGAYVSFPLWCRIFAQFQTIDPSKFNVVVKQLAPNVGVLYATILALTLQVLYSRFTRIQEHVTTEAMLLSQITRNLISLFTYDPEWAQEACQLIANQLRFLVSRTRGVELLSIMKADTYSNILALVDDYHYFHGSDDDFSAAQESTLSMLRSELTQITEVRALRLSDEASSLPPTHFLLISSLSFVSAVAYVTASLAVVDDLNHPPQEASLLFAGLMALYILFFNFCRGKSCRNCLLSFCCLLRTNIVACSYSPKI
jgi:hypothetical protein